MPSRSLYTIIESSAVGGFANEARLPADFPRGDTEQNNGRSRLLIFEDGVPLGPAHSFHADIASKGEGRYSHWESTLFFSASDNSDPRLNGRQYHLFVPRAAVSGVETSLTSPKEQALHSLAYFEPLEGHAFLSGLPMEVPPGDTEHDAARSQLQVLEDGVPLGPAHALHAEIASEGGGRFSHWGNTLYLSASDNSDPRTNGRVYHAFMPALAEAPDRVAQGESRDRAGMPARPGQVLHRIDNVEPHDGQAFLSRLGPDLPAGDDEQNPTRSRLQLLEDGVPLGPPHTLHWDIASKGEGRFSHWHRDLYFAASDNSDPRSNGRVYQVLLPREAEPAPPKAKDGEMQHEPVRQGQILHRISRFEPHEGQAFRFRLPPELPLGDADGDASRSTLQVLEDGVPLGPAHALHSDIVSKGQGRYSHWGDTMYLSASDGSDPRTNGRDYQILMPARVEATGPRLKLPARERRQKTARELQHPDWERLGLDVTSVGETGENLAILVRCSGQQGRIQRMTQSLRTALPSFEGQIVFVSDGELPQEDATESGDEASAALRRVSVQGGDLSTGRGLNAAISDCGREWVLIVDDDLSFDPALLGNLDQLTATSPASFFSVAVEGPDGEPRIEDLLLAYPERSAIRFRLLEEDDPGNFGQPGADSPLVHALWMGPILVKARAFGTVGGFDPEFSEGIERLDLSVRLNQARIPILPAAVKGLVREPQSALPYAAEFAPVFAAAENAGQAERFERKHKIPVTELRPSEFARLRDAYTLPFARDPLGASAPDRRPRVALIIDWDNWAFASISRQIVKHTSDQFKYIVIPSGCITNPAQMLMMCEGCDLVHVFFRPYIDWLFGDYGQYYYRSIGADPESFLNRFVRDKILTTGIYDHLFLDDEHRGRMQFILSEITAGYYVSSNKLAAIYNDIEGFRKPAAVIPDGVDLGRFVPRNLERFDAPQGRELIVGWVGNSAWRSDLEDMKGVHSILSPAMERVNARGPVLRARFADRNTTYVPPDEMPSYYNGIDVLVCSSKIEGTPNPVLEAMASGVPVISTDVGIVPDAFGPLQRRFILPERNVDCMAAALEDLSANRHLLRQLSQENLVSIQPWDWSIRAQPFRQFFQDALETRQTRSAHRPELASRPAGA